MQFGSEFWAAIAGAVVGGAIAAVLQLVTVWVSARERRKTELTLRQAQARSLLFKVVKILSGFRIYKNHLDNCRQRAANEGAPFGWSWFAALANLPRSIWFSADEMGTLVACKDNDLFNDIAGLDDVHNGLIQSLALYRERRAALSDMLPARRMEGAVGTIEMDREAYERVAPRMAELDQMVSDLGASFEANIDVGFKLAKRLAAAFNETYSLGMSVTPKALEQAAGAQAEC